MNELILVKYASEIFLKGLNKNKFEKKLRDNIKKKLKGLEYEIIIDQGRYFIKSDNIQEAVNRVKRVFGVAEVCIVIETKRDMQAIKEEALKKVIEASPKTFKIETNRANKLFPKNSLETSKEVGGYVFHNIEGIGVDVKNPDCLVNIEIREKAYIYTTKDKIKGVGGLPYGINGSTMLMLSGGIDSPVAGYLMARRGVELNCIYYHSHPYTSERAKEKVKELAKILATYTEKVNLYIVPFTEIQMAIINGCPEDELTIIMRRFMMRVACSVAEDKGIQSVSSGESIGQVASQTMEGLMVSNDCADRPVFRPLIAMDKSDIMDIAREIGTYETSILPYEDCCTIFVPKHPKTKPRVDLIRKSEEVLDVDSLVRKAVDEMELVTF
ncbi:tRNA uracil 4-sulfurtransferase ThiI [Clostridium chauvoei]|uniref:Probable tRNA sulfurtransferase n=2 Tax=Clostridium chauvoei TaxID=46867 RepID=A0A1U6J5R2_9CLOT|nr:tRNA uracil 4-sulfurtransferase ThiI [Clostridium chauvoei]ATD54662.1 tRNA 4-thiouridine(8) synthase ThiI [Clostridium chauvoei]ATD57656.1 tRNA 4-thiouridine(8) synthase ThiI [Clostridium chauvoei]MBX7279958.1 tRNA 4-thiouridine(8) synthase ThiI [Clostridium chauvoei]MBX7282383.1 tRNA 4-thiouridine(8) synthase ThiI [Clostridium chauvoei]MBX7284849.1 tRNA 4-thiouridine(8) synthase ThiI [Clostridium chauvoei]